MWLTYSFRLARLLRAKVQAGGRQLREWLAIDNGGRLAERKRNVIIGDTLRCDLVNDWQWNEKERRMIEEEQKEEKSNWKEKEIVSKNKITISFQWRQFLNG